MERPEISQLCRLCLANNLVNIPIFGEQSDIRQISHKISSCLPVKIAADDLLPKNICGGCWDKLELVYTFWNSSREAEEKLLAWVQQISINNGFSVIPKQFAGPTVEIKEETEDSRDQIIIRTPFDVEEDINAKESEEALRPKRARLSATVKEEISKYQESDNDKNDLDEVEYLTEVKDDSDISDSEEVEIHSSFVNLSGTNADEQQPGPSGKGKDRAALPFNFFVKEEIEIIEEDVIEKLKLEKEIEHKENASIEETDRPKSKIKCNYCDKSYTSRKGVIIHEATHTGEKVYKCDHCPKIYFNPKSFAAHVYSLHNNNKKFHCEVCSKTFYTKYNLQFHQKIHGAQQKIVRKCKYCDKTYNKSITRCGIMAHEASHADEKVYKCDICPKIYTNPYSFKNHYNICHINNEILKCETCNKTFTTKYSWRKHQKIHANVRQKLLCGHCGKTFSEKNSIRKHIIIFHINKKTYAMPV